RRARADAERISADSTTEVRGHILRGQWLNGKCFRLCAKGHALFVVLLEHAKWIEGVAPALAPRRRQLQGQIDIKRADGEWTSLDWRQGGNERGNTVEAIANFRPAPLRVSRLKNTESLGFQRRPGVSIKASQNVFAIGDSVPHENLQFDLQDF